MQTRKLTEVPKSDFAKEANLIVEIDEELKRVPGTEISSLITDEADRAKAAEKVLSDNLSAETVRAVGAENANADNLSAEITRAKGAEKTLTDNLASEVTRAKAAEQVLTDNLGTEAARAQAAEETLTDNLAAEITRSKGAEKTLTDNLSAEVTRAKAAEKANADNLSSEITRAQAKETELQGNIDAHTSTVAGEIQALKAADTALDEKKANTADVNQELGNRYTKDQVFTKQEVLQKIEDLIGSAPDTLDTFKEIADALGNDPNFAATIMNELSGKVDKVTGKQLTSNDYSDSEKAIVADVNSKKHTHSNKSVIDKITQGLLDNWSAAYTHISDAVKHITATERTNWTDAYNKRHEHGNKSVLDEITQAFLDNWNAAYTHVSDAVKHITSTERTNWNDADTKKHTHSNKTVIDKVTQAMLDKLAGIAAGAEVNVQSDWSVTDTGSDAFIKNKPASLPANGGAAETAEKFKTARTINGVAFDGSKNITVEANTPIKALTNESLNDIKTFGDYYAAGGNTVTNKPDGVQHFGLRVLRVASGFIGQELDVNSRKWSRMFSSTTNTWSNWVEFYSEGYKPAWGDVTGKPSSFPPSSHTHAKAQITDFPSSLKNPNAFTLQLNGTSQGAYDGSTAKSVNITPAAINALSLTGGTITGILNANKGVTIPTIGSSWINGMNATQLMTFTGNSTGGYHPMIKYIMNSGNVAHIGACINAMGFYGYKKDRTENGTDCQAFLDLENNCFCSNEFRGPLNGNATSASVLKTARKIGNASFNGSADITLAGIGAAASSHTHTKSQISDMPTKLSQFTNDSGYITQADVDTSQNHTHANKAVLDKITQSSLDTWNGKAGTAVATQTVNGLMAAADKKKLDGVAAGANNYAHPTTSGNKHIPSGGASGQILRWSADGTAVWGADNNTTYSVFKAATASAAGGTGLVPAPAAGAQAKYLRADGTWQTPPNTTYTHPNSGVTAGTYKSVTVDALGHVTAGTNPTTLSGYGITDAAAKSHTHNYAGSSSAGGAAASAVKLSTARKIGNASFDGTADITIESIGAAAVSHNHTAGQVTQDSTHRFTTDSEKEGWNKILFHASINVPASGWSSDIPYTQTIPVTGLTAAMDIMPTLDITSSSTAAQVAGWKKAFGMIDDGETVDGSITFKCYSKKPSVDLPLYLKCV